jgi:hypothetical protein
MGMANIGSLDRVLRVVAGLALIGGPIFAAASFASLGPWRYAVIAAGIVMLATALFRFCPAYRLLGIRTCPLDHG